MTVTWDDTGGLVDAHEQFMAGVRVDSDVRSPVLDSWKRCRSAGVKPHRLVVPYAPDLALDERFLRAAGPVLKDLTAALTQVGMTVALCDAQARMVQRLGGDRHLRERLDAVSFAPGFHASEQTAGTNGVGTALAERSPCYVIGREHFADCLQPFACAGAPVRDPLSGHIEAVLDITCLRDNGDPGMVRLVREAARDIEARLLEQATARERALLAAYRRASHDTGGAGGWLGRPGHTASRHGGAHNGGDLRPVDLAVLREKAEALIASPNRTLDEVPVSGGRIATLLRRQVRGAAGETGVVVEARLLGGPRLRHPAHDAQATPAGTEPVTVPEVRVPSRAPSPIGTPPFVMPVAVPHKPVRAGPEPGSRTGTDGNGGADGADGWPLLVGELGVGRLAVLARRRLKLLYDAGVRIGTTLDVTRTAEELAEVAGPRFADFVTVDLAERVLRGEEPEPPARGQRDAPDRAGRRPRRRPSLPRRGPGHVRALHAAGARPGERAGRPRTRSGRGRRLARPGPAAARAGAGVRHPLADHRAAAGPRRACWAWSTSGARRSPSPSRRTTCPSPRSWPPAPRSASTTPAATPASTPWPSPCSAACCPGRCPSRTPSRSPTATCPPQAGVGGDWFDVIPLPGARVALVVGDVVGHGLHAAATMGRLRTAVHNFSALDLPPDELLGHLDELVGRIDQDEGRGGGDDRPPITGATCLYAIYDPVSRQLHHRPGRPPAARAGRTPTARWTSPTCPSGPPLGLGGLPFETAELELPEGSRLVLYTDGLVERPRPGHRRRPATCCATPWPSAGQSPEETCEAVLDALLPEPAERRHRPARRPYPRAGRRRRSPSGTCPPTPPPSPGARAAVTDQLADWGLDELAFTTELILSELVTNAIRHATGPIRVRLLRDRTLICEVSDGSSTSPHLRHAAHHGRGRTRPVPRRPVRRALGHPLHHRRQGHLGRAAIAATAVRIGSGWGSPHSGTGVGPTVNFAAARMG